MKVVLKKFNSPYFKNDKVDIDISEDVVRYLENQDTDYRICTACEGATLVPINRSRPKKSDIIVGIEKKKLYISAHQAPIIKKVDMNMFDTSSCSLFE